MENKKIIVAIDGYSSTGKSTFARLVAKKLGYVYIDTGAIYRAITYFAYTNGFIDNSRYINAEWLAGTLGSITLAFETSSEDGSCHICLNGVNVEKNIRKMEISEKVSQIAALPFVREYVDRILKRYGKERGVVMDGRDIGTAVFPDAELKIFMVASARVRAERRFKEIVQNGGRESFEQVLENLKKRDYMDEHRAVAPLVKAEDALLLDNSNMSVNDQLDWLREILKVRFGIDITV